MRRKNIFKPPGAETPTLVRTPPPSLERPESLSVDLLNKERKLDDGPIKPETAVTGVKWLTMVIAAMVVLGAVPYAACNIVPNLELNRFPIGSKLSDLDKHLEGSDITPDTAYITATEGEPIEESPDMAYYEGYYAIRYHKWSPSKKELSVFSGSILLTGSHFGERYDIQLHYIDGKLESREWWYPFW